MCPTLPGGRGTGPGVGCRQRCVVTMPNKTFMGNDSHIPGWKGGPGPGSWTGEYNNDVWVYDTQRAVFGTVEATSKSDAQLLPPHCGGFPLNDNLPQVNVRGEKVIRRGR